MRQATHPIQDATPSGELEVRSNAKICELYVAGSYAGSDRATEQDGQQVLHLDLRQHAQAGGSVVLRLLALRPKGQLQLQSCTWTPALPPDEADPATLAAAAASSALPQTASAQRAAQGMSQQEQLRGMLKQQMGPQQGLHAAFRGDGSNGAATSPSLNEAAGSGAQPAGIGGLGALAALFGPAGPRAPGMHSSSPQHLGSSPANSNSVPGDAAESGVAAATRGPAGGPMQALMGAIAKGMLLKDQKERIASQQAAALQAPQQDTGEAEGQASLATMLADQNVLLGRILAAQEANARHMDAQDARTSELVASVAKIAEGVAQLQERQKGFADTLSQLRGSLAVDTDGCAVISERAAADAGPSM